MIHEEAGCQTSQNIPGLQTFWRRTRLLNRKFLSSETQEYAEVLAGLYKSCTSKTMKGFYI